MDQLYEVLSFCTYKRKCFALLQLINSQNRVPRNRPGQLPGRPEAGRIFDRKWKENLIKPMEDQYSLSFWSPFPGQRRLSPRQDPEPDPGSRAARRGLAEV